MLRFRRAASLVAVLAGLGLHGAAQVPETLGRQLHTYGSFDPVCSRFFLHAADSLGIIPAVFATADRITRASTISRAGSALPVREGVDAYRLHRRTLASLPPFVPGGQIDYPLDGSRNASDDFGFLEYLIANDLHPDALVLMRQMPYAPSDTLWYMRGRAEMTAGHFDTASRCFDRVGAASALREKAFFYSVVAYILQRQLALAAQMLERYDGDFKELSSLQAAGLALLEGDDALYKSSSAGFTYSDYSLGAAERALEEIFSDRQKRSHKSPWAAAALSAVVPGAGKVYAGNLREGVSSFLTVGSLAAVTLNCAARCGRTDWKTIAAGTLCGIFYIGNIYGSAVSVSIYNDQMRSSEDLTVLYNIHIPIHSVLR